MSRFLSGIRASVNRVANSVTEVVAPIWTNKPIESFKQHWTAVTQEHEALVQHAQNNIDDAKLLRESKIRDRLEAMVKLLREENEEGLRDKEETVGTGPVRPCLEYLLENRVLEILCALGLADRPPGMMALVLQVLNALVKHIKHELLPHMSVHNPVCHIIRVCLEAGRGGVGPGQLPGVSSRVQNSLVSLLHTIWAKVRDDPTQLSFFYEDARHVQEPQLLVFNGLLPHMHSTRKAGEKAREALLWAMQLDDDRLMGYVAKNTTFCHSLVEGIISAYSALPASDEGCGQEGADAAAAQAMTVFSRRIQFCANVVAGATAHTSPSIDDGEAVRALSKDRNGLVGILLRDLRVRFFDQVLRPALLEIAEPAALAATKHARLVLDTLAVWGRGGPLLDSYVRFLLRCPTDGLQAGRKALAAQRSDSQGSGLSDGGSPAVGSSARKAPAGGAASVGLLGDALLQRIESQADDLSEATLELFSSLLDLNDPWVLRQLVLKHLEDRTHLETVPDAERETNSERKTATSPAAAVAATDGPTFTSPTRLFLAEFPGSPTPNLGPKAAEAPPIAGTPEGKLSELADGMPQEAVFEDYLTDAQTQSAARIAAYLGHRDPSNLGVVSDIAASIDRALVTDADSKDDDEGDGSTTPSKRSMVVVGAAGSSLSASQTFQPGLFMQMLLHKLERLLDQSLGLNLVLTGVLSRLAQCPQPLLHMYLFGDSFGPGELGSVLGVPTRLKRDVRTVTAVLQQVWAEARRRASHVEDFPGRLADTRKTLGVDGGELAGDAAWGGGPGEMKDSLEADQFHVAEKNFLEAYVLLEEFLKELASTLEAKSNLQSLAEGLR